MKLHQRRSACKAHIEHGFTVALLQCNMFFEKKKKYGSYYTYYIMMVNGKTFNIVHALERFKQL